MGQNGKGEMLAMQEETENPGVRLRAPCFPGRGGRGADNSKNRPEELRALGLPLTGAHRSLRIHLI